MRRFFSLVLLLWATAAHADGLPTLTITPFDVSALPPETQIRGSQIMDHTVTDTQLSAVNGNVGTFGAATKSPAITVTAEGRVTGVTEITIAPVGMVTGSGTTGKVAQWTSASALGDGPIGANIVLTTGSYADPSWVTSLAASKLTGQVAIANGGTGQATASAGFDALSPMTALGDVIYGGASGANTRLAGNTAATKKFFTQTGSGTISAAPAWAAILAADVPTLNQNTTGSAGTLNPGRTINGTTFDGSANITVTADANTLTNTTLHSTIVASSLTSVGTLTGGATGAGFTVALSTSTVTGTLGLARGGLGFDASGIAKGGMISGTGAGTAGITTVGADGTVWTADAASVGGAKWSAAGSGTVSGSGTTGKIPKWSSSSALTDSIITEASSVLTATGSLNVVATNVATTALSARYNSSNFQTGFVIGNANGFVYVGNNLVAVASSDTPNYDLAGTATQLRLDSGKMQFANAPSGSAGAAAALTTRFVVDTNGYVGIGATSPGAKLDVRDSISGGTAFAGGVVAALMNTAGASKYTTLHFTDNATSDQYISYFSGTTQATSRLGFGGTAEDMSIVNHKVGIGTTNPSNPLEVKGDAGTPGIDQTLLLVTDTHALAASVGGGILFEGVYTSGGGLAAGASIKMMKANGTDGNYSFDLAFGTRANGGSLTEQMRIFASGGISIGSTTDPGAGNFSLVHSTAGDVTLEAKNTNTGGSARSMLALTTGSNSTYLFHYGANNSGGLTGIADELLLYNGVGSSAVAIAAAGSGGIVTFFAGSATQIAQLRHVAPVEFFLTDTGLTGNANGTGAVSGNRVHIGENTSGSGAAGSLWLYQRGGSVGVIWSDASRVLRISNGAPTEDNTTISDTSGTVVGTQTSTRASKNVYGEFTDYEGALRTVLATPLWNFDYKSGAYNGQRFVGITTDDSPIFGMDLGRSFNPVTAFGYTVASFRAMQAEIDQLRAEVRRRR